MGILLVVAGAILTTAGEGWFQNAGQVGDIMWIIGAVVIVLQIIFMGITFRLATKR